MVEEGEEEEEERSGTSDEIESALIRRDLRSVREFSPLSPLASGFIP